MKKILNATRKTVLAENAEMAESSLAKAKGLMFRKSLDENSGLLMKFDGEARHSIWMPFMRFPLDLVFISGDKRVADMKENIRPISRSPKTWRIYTPKKKCRWVLEISAGKISETKTELNDVLKF
jgi:uncharacterized membrane protein (UPF0127 family)